jgi:NADPH2:quinone reductase
MKAVLCKAYGPPDALILEEITPPQADRHQVVIDVKVCGVSFPDTLLISGKYQFKPPMPFAPGGEVAGIVKAVGAEVTQFQVGDRVAAFTGWGGFAEEVVTDVSRVQPLPDEIDFATGAACSMTYATAYYALKDRGQLKAGEKLLVLGASGGVGLASIEIGKAMGAHVIAATSSAEKLEVCQQHGADKVINYTTEDLKERVKALTGGNGVDVIFDPVGGAYAEPALRGMTWRGRYLVIGFAAGDIPRIPLNLVLLKGCEVVGVFWGTFATREPERNRTYLQELFSLVATGKLRPLISTTYPLSRAADALNDMLQRKVKGKVLLQIDEI